MSIFCYAFWVNAKNFMNICVFSLESELWMFLVIALWLIISGVFPAQPMSLLWTFTCSLIVYIKQFAFVYFNTEHKLLYYDWVWFMCSESLIFSSNLFLSSRSFTLFVRFEPNGKSDKWMQKQMADYNVLRCIYLRACKIFSGAWNATHKTVYGWKQTYILKTMLISFQFVCDSMPFTSRANKTFEIYILLVIEIIDQTHTQTLDIELI